MKRIFSKSDFNNPRLASYYDEMPLWSAPFGLRLLDAIDYSKPVTALDIGCGTGFPLLELAQRFGLESQFTGIDPWLQGLERINEKLRFCEIENISLLQANAESLPFKNETFNLITSNNGLNNVSSLKDSLVECYRVSKLKARLVFTANLPGTFSLFYETLINALGNAGIENPGLKVNQHINKKRKSINEMSQLLSESGYSVKAVQKEFFSYKFSSGTSFLNHFLIRLYFVNSWKSLVPEDYQFPIFQQIEKKLNLLSRKNKEIVMDVPFALYKAEKKY